MIVLVPRRFLEELSTKKGIDMRELIDKLGKPKKNLWMMSSNITKAVIYIVHAYKRVHIDG